jgi:hypothetical protein
VPEGGWPVSAATRWFTFRQNNSFGRLVQTEDLDVWVIIEAADLSQATARAEKLGMYFDGCAAGRDCHCCGDRWYPPHDEGAEPLIYGEPMEKHAPGIWGVERAVIHGIDVPRREMRFEKVAS